MLKVGIIGVGSMGTQHFLRLMNRINGATVTAVSDVNEAHAREVIAPYPGVRYIADPIALIRDPEVDAIVIVSIDSTHEKFCLEALAQKKYILPLSGMSGRTMVRGWYEGRFEALYDNIRQWYDDLRLTLPGGRGDAKLPRLKRLCIVLLKPGGDPARVFDRMDKELAALLNRMFCAVVNGTPVPDAAASRALYTLRSRLLDSESDDDRQRSARPPLAIYQLLKCWLVRRQRERGEVLMEDQLRLDYPGVAYQCGRLMAVYAAIQQAAMGHDLGTGVVERYYGAAIVSPRFVLGSLSRLSNYHLSKIENPDHAMRYRRMLNEISTHIAPGSIPRLMTMEQQTEFALGYYQQNAAIYTKAPETDD